MKKLFVLFALLSSVIQSKSKVLFVHQLNKGRDVEVLECTFIHDDIATRIDLPKSNTTVFSNEFKVIHKNKVVRVDIEDSLKDTKYYQNDQGYVSIDSKTNEVNAMLLNRDLGIAYNVNCDSNDHCVSETHDMDTFLCGIEQLIDINSKSKSKSKNNKNKKKGKNDERIVWNNCFPDFNNKYYKIRMGGAVTRRTFEFYNKDINKVIKFFQDTVSASNLIYRYQMHLSVDISQIYIGKSSDKWANPDCKRTTNDLLVDFRTWDPNVKLDRESFWMLMERCPNYNDGVSGVAYIGQVCKTNYNVGFTKSLEQVPLNPVRTFAHELGHLLSAKHSFENGAGKTGGIMDYSDGMYKGYVQFNNLRRDEFCNYITKMINSLCPRDLMYAERTPTPSPTPSPTSKCNCCDLCPVPVCGNNKLEIGETCECPNGKRKCKFCKNCQLKKNKQCPYVKKMDTCCTKKGMFEKRGTRCIHNNKEGKCDAKGNCV